MVLDPVSALSIGSAVVQFLHFTGSLFSKAKELRRDGEHAFVEIRELEAIAQTLVELDSNVCDTVQVIHLKSRPSLQEQSLQSLCTDVSRVASQLLQALESIKVRSRHEKWRSFREALGMVWKADRIEEMSRTLDRYRAQLDTFLLIAVRNRVDLYTETQNEMDQKLQSLKEAQKLTLRAVSNVEERLGAAILGCNDIDLRWQTDLVESVHHQNMQPYRENSSGRRCINWDDTKKFSANLSSAMETQRRTYLKTKFVKRLEFPYLRDRHLRIQDAHYRTFQWIFEKSNESPSNLPSFAHWLETDRNIFWITGKPASGKSTCMKLIYDHPTTRTCLKARVCDGTSQVILAGYFFWKAGNSMQKSQAGLLQTLLFEVLRQRPSLVPVVFPDRWESFVVFGDCFHALSWTELRSAFRSLVEKATKDILIFFVIDGLDECEDDHDELVDLLKEAASSPHIKLCVGSRPEQTFKDALGSCPNLRMQDLTLPDIIAFVDDKVCHNKRFQSLKQKEPRYAEKLIQTIATKSSGVFLWVVLVVRSLLEGLRNSDRIVDMERRLEQIPPELDDLYAEILQSLDPFYLDHASQLFQLNRSAQETISLLDLSFADEEDGQLALKPVPSPPTEDELFSRCEAMDRRLTSRCKGLIESQGGYIAWTNSRENERDDEPLLEEYREVANSWSESNAETSSGNQSRCPDDTQGHQQTPSALSESTDPHTADDFRGSPRVERIENSVASSSQHCATSTTAQSRRRSRLLKSVSGGIHKDNLNDPYFPEESEMASIRQREARIPRQTRFPPTSELYDRSISRGLSNRAPLSESTPRWRTAPYWEVESELGPSDKSYGFQRRALPQMRLDNTPAASAHPMTDPSFVPGPARYIRPSSSHQGQSRPRPSHTSVGEMLQGMQLHTEDAMLLQQCSHSIAHDPRRIPKVDYLHRTAKDFIERPQNWAMLLSANRSPFNPELALLRSSILHLKSLSPERLTLVRFWSAIKWCMLCAKQAEAASRTANVALVDEINRAAAQLAQKCTWDELTPALQPHSKKTPNLIAAQRNRNATKNVAHWVSTEPGCGEQGANMICLAVQYDLQHYVQAKHAHGTEITRDNSGRPMLDYVFCKASIGRAAYLIEQRQILQERSTSLRLPNAGIVKLLLEAGADPNEWSSNSTPWQRALEMLSELNREVEFTDERERSGYIQAWYDIIRAFVLGGADPKADLNGGGGSYVREMFEMWDIDKAQRLEKLIRKSSRKLPRWVRSIAPVK